MCVCVCVRASTHMPHAHYTGPSKYHACFSAINSKTTEALALLYSPSSCPLYICDVSSFWMPSEISKSASSLNTEVSRRKRNLKDLNQNENRRTENIDYNTKRQLIVIVHPHHSSNTVTDIWKHTIHHR